MEESRRIAVAVLNIKNLPDALYKKLQARAKRQHRSIAQEVTHLLTDALEAPKPLSILDLKGLGKEHWRGIDASKHVKEERSSWD
jgi:plasmid stability protein